MRAKLMSLILSLSKDEASGLDRIPGLSVRLAQGICVASRWHLRGIPALGFALILLAGCGSAPESMMITADTALISASGGNGDARTKLVDKSLLEAAKITQAHGYQFFTVLAADDAPRIARKFVPPAYVYQNGFTDPRNRPGNVKSKDTPVNDITPVGASVTYMRPGLDITIRMYHDGEVDPAKDGVWSSAKILAGAAPVR